MHVTKGKHRLRESSKKKLSQAIQAVKIGFTAAVRFLLQTDQSGKHHIFNILSLCTRGICVCVRMFVYVRRFAL